MKRALGDKIYAERHSMYKESKVERRNKRKLIEMAEREEEELQKLRHLTYSRMDFYSSNTIQPWIAIQQEELRTSIATNSRTYPTSSTRRQPEHAELPENLSQQRFNLLCSGVDAASAQGHSSDTNPPLEPIPVGVPIATACTPVSQINHNQINPLMTPCSTSLRFEPLPFCDTIAELVRPSLFTPKGNGPFHENSFSFTLTAPQAHQVTMTRDLRSGVSNELDARIQLRFSLVENMGKQDYNFPKNLTVKINEKVFEIPVPTPSNRAGVEPKRPNKPIDITSGCKLSPYVSNEVTISWTSEFGKNYGAVIYLVRRLSATVLLQRLKEKGPRSQNYTRVMISEKFRADLDDEICTTTLKAPLTCPLGKIRMQYPCRAITCNHLQCFDAKTFLQMNEKKPTWACPVCDKQVVFHDIAIDGLFLDIVSKAPEECTDVQFTEDGRWSPVLGKKGNDSSSCSKVRTEHENTSPRKVDVVDIIELSSDSDEDDTVPMACSSSAASTSCPSTLMQPVIHQIPKLNTPSPTLSASYLPHMSPSPSSNSTFVPYSPTNVNPYYPSVQHSSSPSNPLCLSSRMCNIQAQNSVPSNLPCDLSNPTMYSGNSGYSQSPYAPNPYNDPVLNYFGSDSFRSSDVYNFLSRMGDSNLLPHSSSSTSPMDMEMNSMASNHRTNIYSSLDDIISLE